MKAYTHDQVLEAFTRSGCKLLSTYKNTKTKLDWVCSCGKPQSCVFKSRSITDDEYRILCRSCSSKKSKNAPTYSEFCDMLSREGWTMVSTTHKYGNTKTLMRVTDSIGLPCTTSYNRFRAGHRSKAECVQGSKLTHTFIAKKFADRGYELLEEYIECHISMKYICICGNIHKRSYNNMRTSKVDCPQCVNDKAIFTKKAAIAILCRYDHLTFLELPGFIAPACILRYSCVLCGDTYAKPWSVLRKVMVTEPCDNCWKTVVIG